jgi:hypothetical protein
MVPSDDELLDALREGAAASRYHYLTTRDYAAWQKCQPARNLPTVNQITARFSGWMNSQALAGLDLGEPSVLPDTTTLLPELELGGIRIVDYLPLDADQECWLAAIGIVLVSWRNGPFEDVHAGSGVGAIDDGEMLRSNAALVRGVSAELAATEDLRASLLATRRLIVDPKRRLPDGRSVQEVCGPLYKNVVRHANGVVAGIVYRLRGNESGDVRRFLVANGVISGWSWHGTPWWPRFVEGFVGSLSTAEMRERAQRIKVEPEIRDPTELRCALIAGPDTLPPDTAYWCVAMGLAFAKPADPR